MKALTALAAVLALFVAVTVAPKTARAAEDSSWTTDYQNALQTAKNEKKMVLLDFTGSDWCGWCMKLDKEVFSTPEFKDFAAKNLVLVKVDFPRSVQQTAAVKAQNQKLAQQYKIEGYPTIIVLNADGKPVGELGYEPGGPSAFIGKLKTLPQS
ncbi:MAG: thioredoxin family protein [Verrucomicrobia bacterium]|nr:thioredoxin family protein [Verrucomicrobiota bacterium]